MAGRQRMQMAPVKFSTTRLGGGVTALGVSYPGGLDLTTPSLSLQPGSLRAAVNFECSQSGGYGRIQGYERFSGKAAPSAATYQIVQVEAFVNVPTVGQVITQATSGATGTIIAVESIPQYLVTESGDPIFDELGNYIYASPLCYVAVTLVTGTFDYSHVITTPGPVTVGTATPTTAVVTSRKNAQYLAAAADVYRALIAAVPGSGNLLGVVGAVFGGTARAYAFRANIGATAVALYKSTPTGWTLVPFYNTVNFTAGGAATPAAGETLTQGGVTATIKRVMTRTGTWTGTAAGGFVITNPAGGNFAAGAATTSGGATVTLSGIQTAITLAPGGRFEFVKCNFSGQASTQRVYGCDGVNPCFEFDGDTLAPITTGLSPDRPSHIAFHKNYLFLSKDSSIFFSAPGTPFNWSAVSGAGEIATGDIVTGMITMPGSQTAATLAVYMQHNTALLYGTGLSDFNYVLFNQGAGAYPYSIQNLFDTFCLDQLGVVTLRTTLNFGNFSSATLTKSILPFVQQERNKTTASSVMRDKSQYRVFFSDGYGLYLTIVNQNYLGAIPVLFPNPVFCCDSGDDAIGSEVTYFGSNDGLGYVYELDAGTSFDGASISAYISLAWDPLKSPRDLKRFRNASIEIQSSSYVEVAFGYQLGYGSPNIGQPASVTYPSSFSAAPIWDASVTWDSGVVWDGQTLSPTDVDMTGTGENVQAIITCEGNYLDSFQVNSIIYAYSQRRALRV